MVFIYILKKILKFLLTILICLNMLYFIFKNLILRFYKVKYTNFTKKTYPLLLYYLHVIIIKKMILF